ncbi:MAG: antitermination factor NusG [Pirellulaceae bacterium]|nr:MAG: antitermination factor NusG [Pirellulaceae bacterium]
MPLLQREADLYPLDLLDRPDSERAPWWALYTMARQEKKLMRLLLKEGLPFYAPVIPRRYRSPGGRLRTSYEPLFPNYVFLCGDNEIRYRAVCTGCVSRFVEVGQPEELVGDLRQIRDLIATDAPLAPERRLEPGQRVRIRTGAFAGYEGVIVRREKEVRLIVFVRFMAQGVSVAIDDCQADPL